jgi:hypothetical protein
MFKHLVSATPRKKIDDDFTKGNIRQEIFER